MKFSYEELFFIINNKIYGCVQIYKTIKMKPLIQWLQRYATCL